jgi:protease IV
MRSFLKFTLATIVGGFILLLLVFGFFAAIIGGLASSFEKDSQAVKENTVLVLDFNGNISDRGIEFNLPSGPFEGFDLEGSMGLYEIINYLHFAAKDDKVKGAMLKLDMAQSGLATYEELYHALKHFRDSGKFIIAHGPMVNEKAMLLASLADERFLDRAGRIDFNGFFSQILYFSEALDQLGIDREIFYIGPYKSFTEPFRSNKMSPENREQVHRIISGVLSHYLGLIAGASGLSEAQLEGFLLNPEIFHPSIAEQAGLITRPAYLDEAKAIMAEKCGLEPDGKEKVNYIGLKQYRDAVKKQYLKQQSKSDNRVALVFAEGTILDTDKSDGEIGGTAFRRLLAELREDEKVKAVVIRVNSPGGSAVASEIIWREVGLLAEKVPVVVSMGNVAASGGYYIACPASKIYANHSTVTGSIGIVFMWPVMKRLAEEHLHLKTDSVMTHPYADALSNNFRPLNDRERELGWKYIKLEYGQFVAHVGEGRGMDSLEVDAIAQGRVWSGMDALEIGLVDELGGLHAAIEEAARLAELEEYRVHEYPKSKSLRETIMGKVGAEAVVPELVLASFPELRPYWNQLNYLRGAQGTQYIMPFEIVVH